MATSLISLTVIVLLLSFSRPVHLKEGEEPLTSYCIQDKDCNPQIFNNQNLSQYVQCSHEGLCQCSSCFILNTTGNQCYTQPGCTLYDNVTSTCYDIRKRQTIAIIYAAALAIGGAANFYIERWELAIPQAIIGILFTLMPLVAYCLKSGLDYEFDPYEYEGPVIKVSWSVLGVAWSLITLIMGTWYITDLIIFSLNKRMDGRGCPLR